MSGSTPKGLAAQYPDRHRRAPIDAAKVLIVDDHAEIRRLLTVSLQGEYQILEAVDGASALLAIRRQHPRVVLLDVMMPGGINGLDVLDSIKSDPLTSSILVALVTARGQVVDLDDARKRGADAYFTKPFSPLKVITWLRSSLSGASDRSGNSGQGV